MKKLKITYEVVEDLDLVCDEESFKKDFDSDPMRLCQFLAEDGIWFDSELKVKSAEIIEEQRKGERRRG